MTKVDSAYPPVSYGYRPAREYVENYTDTYINPDAYPVGSRPCRKAWTNLVVVAKGTSATASTLVF